MNLEVATGSPAMPGPAEALLVPPRQVGEALTLGLGGGHDIEELVVFVGPPSSIHTGRLPLAGRHQRAGEVLTFVPMFGFEAGQVYVVRYRIRGEPPRVATFRIPSARSVTTAVVTDVFPSGDVLPENVLRFYIHFSVPMAAHRASDFIRLRDASGAVDDAAFMRFKQELWNEDRTRLTVLVDPGRIKREVATHRTKGPALVEGRQYALTIDAGWPSADGTSTLPQWCKRFRVAAPLRTRPDAASWTWEWPHAETRDPLTIRFDRPLDRHLLIRILRVTTRDGRAICGVPRVGEAEMSWSFVPDAPWTPCDALVLVDEMLEDVAGNNVQELLDQPLVGQ